MRKIILVTCLSLLSIKGITQKCNLVSVVSKTDIFNDDDTAYGVGDDGIYTIHEPEVTINSKDNSRYSCRHLADYNLRTAWVFNTASQGKLRVNYRFDLTGIAAGKKAFQILTLAVCNGYRKSAFLWEANSRARYVNVWVGEREVGRVELKDTYKL